MDGAKPFEGFVLQWSQPLSSYFPSKGLPRQQQAETMAPRVKAMEAQNGLTTPPSQSTTPHPFPTPQTHPTSPPALPGRKQARQKGLVSQGQPRSALPNWWSLSLSLSPFFPLSPQLPQSKELLLRCHLPYLLFLGGLFFWGEGDCLLVCLRQGLALAWNLVIG